MKNKAGIFTVSLDFELYWGLRDKRSIRAYEQNLKGVHEAVNRILGLFDKYQVHATWATVGFLFAKDMEELNHYSPFSKPKYEDINLDPYKYIKDNHTLENLYHFAPVLVNNISKYQNQEIASHTFSHYYCLEKGQTKNEFDSDIQAAVNVAKDKGISLESLVFPRNQWNVDYLSVLHKYGIKSYRGNEKGWIYEAVGEKEENLFRRGIRLLDSYINLSGSNSYKVQSINTTSPYNIPSSRFLRPVSSKLSLIEGLRRRRITNSLLQAAKNGEIFHLWWHPHNFGINIDANINFLEIILQSFTELKEEYDMKSLNMKEISELVAD